MPINFEAPKVFTEFTNTIANSDAVIWLGRQITVIQGEFSSANPFTKVAFIALLVIIPIWLSLEIYQYVSNQKKEAELKKDTDQVWENIPDKIKQFHAKLFEKTSIKTSDLPFYPKENTSFEIDKMPAPIIRAETDDGLPFIVIKAECKELNVIDVVILAQKLPNGPYCWDKENGKNERLWVQLTSSKRDVPTFFMGNITCPFTGEVEKGQKAQISKFQDLLAGKEVKCLAGHTWSIPKT